MNNGIAMGVDIGGSHITAGLIDLNTRNLFSDSIKRKKINSSDTAENIIQAWADLLRETISLSSTTRIGIAMPGPFDYEQGISYIKGIAKYESLFGLNVRKLLAQALGISENQIRLKNDAGCFLQGEVYAGSARGYNQSIGLTIGTGIGTAFAKDNIAEDADLWKTPMKGDIAENFLSTRWFVKRYNQLTGKTIQGVKQLCDLVELEPVTVTSIFNEFSQNLAEFLVFFIRQNNPEVVVIGGNISNASNHFFATLKNQLQQAGIEIPIIKSTLGEDALLLGSASLWSEYKIEHHVSL